FSVYPASLRRAWSASLNSKTLPVRGSCSACNARTFCNLNDRSFGRCLESFICLSIRSKNLRCFNSAVNYLPPLGFVGNAYAHARSFPEDSHIDVAVAAFQ